MPKWVYPLAFLFVLFLIFTEPNGAGAAASAFASFLVQLLGSIGEFLTGLFEGASEGGSNVTSTPTTVTGATGAESVPATGDTFTHTHSGLEPHSHSTSGN